MKSLEEISAISFATSKNCHTLLEENITNPATTKTAKNTVDNVSMGIFNDKFNECNHDSGTKY